jgi:hypothetical protein
MSSMLLRGVALVLELTGTGSLAAENGVEHSGEDEDEGDEERD